MRTYKERTDGILKKAEEKRRAAERRKRAVTAGCACAAAVGLGLVLFVPYPSSPKSVARYKDSEYYSVIGTLNELTFVKPEYKNNFEKWTSGIRDFFGMFRYGASAPGKDYSESWGNQRYEETTNNQVLGVTEGDLLKRSDRYAYYLSGGNAQDGSGSYFLGIYSIEGSASRRIKTVEIAPEEGTSFRGYLGRGELYLSEDCTRVTVVTPCYDTQAGRLYTAAIGVDVTSPENAAVAERKYVSGNYVSSRMAGDELILISDFSVKKSPDFSDEAQYLPQTGELGSLTSLPVGDIVCPENAASANYTVLCMLDAATLEVKGSTALLSYSDEVYVSENNIFVTREYDESYSQERYGLSCRYTVTEICCVSYAEGAPEYVGSAVVTGSVNDQYSMDEYEGILRVATTFTCSQLSYSTGTKTDGQGKEFTEFGNNANLYCIDLSDFTLAGSVERFAPDGEIVRSARFDGETAYVCTSTQPTIVSWATDPVYVFDLSDPKNITSKDTGTIDGYSMFLVAFTDETLLGIGYGDGDDVLKIELYREGENAVECVTKYEREGVSFSDDFKAYFIDRERGLVGLGVWDYSVYPDFYGYLMLRFDGYELTEVFSAELQGDADYMRAFYKDGYMYLFGENDFKIVALD